MLASSVAAPAVTRFGKKAQGVSARKAISRVPVGGHKVQVRLLSTSSPDFHPLHRRDGGRRVCRSVRAARAGWAIAHAFDAIVLAASRPGRIHAPTATCGANPTRRPNPIPPYRYLDTSYPISSAERKGSRPRIMRLKPTRAPTTTTQTDHLILVTNHRPRRRLRSPCPPRAPRRPPS